MHQQEDMPRIEAGRLSFSPRLILLAVMLLLTILIGSVIGILHLYGGSSPSVMSQPQLNVYVTDQDMLYKLDFRHGRLLWSYKIGSEILNSEVVDNLVYVNTSGGDIYALDARNGVLRWLKHIKGAYSVVVMNGTCFTTDGGGVYALNAKDGTLEWRYDGGYISPQIVAVAHGFVYVKTAQNTLSALDTRNGTVRWRFQEAGSPLGQFILGVLVDDVMYDAASNSLYAINALDGALIWQSQIDDQLSFNTIQVAHGTIYASSTLFSNAFMQNQNDVYHHEFVFAFNSKNGSRTWTSARGYNLELSLQPTESIVFVTYDQDGLFGLRTNDGTLRWTFKDGCRPGATCNAIPLGIDGRVLYAIELDGHVNNITAVDANSGTIFWQKMVSNYPDSFTSISKGMIYLLSVATSETGHDTIVALRLADISTLWNYRLEQVNILPNLRFPPGIFLAP